MSKEEEKIIIDKAKEGDQVSFAKLYNKYHNLIRYIIYNIVKNNDVTDDLLSITFTKVYKKLNTYVNDISFEMWLKTIAVNTAIDYIRKYKEEQQNHYIDDDNNFVQLESYSEDPETTLIQKENIENINKCIELLKGKYKVLLDLRFNKNKTYREIAEALKAPEGTIKSDLFKARRKLEKNFKKII